MHDAVLLCSAASRSTPHLDHPMLLSPLHPIRFTHPPPSYVLCRRLATAALNKAARKEELQKMLCGLGMQL